MEPKRRPSSLGFSRVWKGVGTQRLRPRGAFPTSPALSEGCRLPEHPGLKTQGRARPLFAPEGARRTPSLHPGAGRASSASSPRARGTRAAGGTWGLSCNASSSRSLSTAGMVPRGGAEGRTKARRAGDAAAESARGSGDEADDVLCPGRPRVRPRLASEWPPPARRPSSPPSPQRSRINRKCGERPTRTPEVWRPRFPPAPTSRGKPQTPTGPPGAKWTPRVLGSAVKGPNLMPVNASRAQEGELKSGKIRFYLLVAIQIFWVKEIGANSFADLKICEMLCENPALPAPLFLRKSQCPRNSSESKEIY